ncbi:hypothetical protein F5B22DRAFT_58276 [Xylaria bambusicola]|uniref:uncharacterized protein n=1 Tax=Xylaria bambusicola TaxID=326684 RepID=UPI0020080BBD|nr:uncharacterized protein F5B22DRAFT_58276 [Xylaria bambusicola]KAI0502774.1 hypothetical protein F5B22DRAFT_58276 [Xylaria bambusicola]
MIFVIILVVSMVAILGIARWVTWVLVNIENKYDNAGRILDLKDLASKNEVASALFRLVSEDGAGLWPPRAAHNRLPSCFQPYQDIYLELIPNLSTAIPALDDDINKQRIEEFRHKMSRLLCERVNILEVKHVLERFKLEGSRSLTQEIYNAVYCCVAVCRHAYRWGTIPVVKQAQNEIMLDFPMELNVPWSYLQRHFELSGESGNMTSNILLNFDQCGKRFYKVNITDSYKIATAEDIFSRIFFNIEVLAFPIYYEIALATTAFADQRKKGCIRHVKNIAKQIKKLLPIFFDNLRDSKIAHAVWLSHVQGFQAWGVGRIVNGKFEKHDGLSGNQLLFFSTIDAFLDLDRYLSDENMERYIPVNQRRLSLAIKNHSFRHKLDDGDVELKKYFKNIANYMRMFRSAHRSRARPYLEHPAPERLIMTAGKSVLETPKTKGFDDAYKPLDDMLMAQLQLTV